MSQDDLASAIDVSLRTLNRMLNAENPPTYNKLLKIAAALNMKLSSIIQRAEALADAHKEVK